MKIKLQPRAAASPSARWRQARIVWRSRASGERRAISAAFIVLLAAFLWWMALSPALRTWRSADAQQRTLDAELLAMRELAAQASRLQALPRMKADDGVRALEASLKPLGSTAQLGIAGERASVSMKNVPADALASWLSDTTNQSKALPQEAHLRLNNARTGWDGTIVLGLPPP